MWRERRGRRREGKGRRREGKGREGGNVTFKLCLESSGKLFPSLTSRENRKEICTKDTELSDVRNNENEEDENNRECGMEGKKKRGRGKKREDSQGERMTCHRQCNPTFSLQDDYRSSFLLLPFDLLLTLSLSTYSVSFSLLCFFQLTLFLSTYSVSSNLLSFFQLSLFSIRFPWNSAIINHWKIELTMQQSSMGFSSRESFALFPLTLSRQTDENEGSTKREREREQSVEMREKREPVIKCQLLCGTNSSQQFFIAVQIGCETTDRLLKLE